MKTAATKLEQLAAIVILLCATVLIAVFVVLPMSMTIRETHDQIAHNQFPPVRPCGRAEYAGG